MAGSVEFHAMGEGTGLAHAEGDLVAAQGGGDEARWSFKGDPAVACGRESVDETGKAACAIAAHFGFPAVGVVVTHAEVGLGFGLFDQEESVGPDAAVAIAEAGDLRAGQGQ